MARILILLCFPIILFNCSGQKEVTLPEPVKPAPAKPETPVKVSQFWDANEISSFIATRNGEITDCYERVKVKVPDLEGGIKFRLKLNPGGFVEEVLVLEETLGNKELTESLKAAILKWKTPVVNTDKPVSVDVPYDFGDYTRTEVQDEKKRSREELVEFCSGKQDELSSCFSVSSEFEKNKTFTFGVSFSILPNGKVSEVKTLESSIQNEDIELCLTNKIKLWKFRAVTSETAQPFSITFTFNF